MNGLNNIFSSCEEDMENILKQLKKEIYRIRLGSKSVSSFLGKIKIKCYETFFPLMEVSNISIIDNMNISIHPWDRSIVPAIEKAIINANLGFIPTNKGDSIHIHLPIITEESRKNLIKRIKLQIEEAKILIRKIRKNNNQCIKKLKISEDISRMGEHRIQKITDEYIQKIEDFFLQKKKEILNI
ncbi:ribosome recycling factor [Blattabacterium cuenoti]